VASVSVRSIIELDGSELFRPKAENNLEGVVANEIDIA
jgi:hypothetical protein